jgi:hypothetical protein
MLEHRRAEPEAELGRGDRRHFAGGLVEKLDLGEGLHDLLAVRADVLHGRGADGAGDARHRLDAGKSLGHGVGDELVPVVARLHLQPCATRHG